MHRINVAVKSRVKAITTRHLNKLGNLCNKRSTYISNSSHISFIKKSVYNMTFHTLIENDYNTLAFGLDHHIPKRTSRNIIDTEFERYVNDILDNKISYLETRLRNICDRCNRIRVPYKFRKIVEKLSRNNSIMILKQDKGGV